MTKSETSAGRVYGAIRKMTEDFEFKPESQINEVALAKRLGTSRTPVREALNRLVAEGFLTFRSRKGFFCRPLGQPQILALYEARVAVECEAVRLALRKASDEELSTLVETLRVFEPEYDQSGDAGRLLELDELFHTEIAKLSKNPELQKFLTNLNGRIRFVRLLDLKKMLGAAGTVNEDARITAHQNILSLISKRNEEAAVNAMRRHIERRREEAADAVARAFIAIYAGGD